MRRMEALALAAMLVTTGCIGAMAQGDPAKEHRSTADEEAYVQDPNAELVSVSGMEMNESWDEGEDHDGSWWSANVSLQDERIGDGGAPVWTYEYQTDNETITVVVNEDGEIVHKEREEGADEDAAAIEDWQVSSIEAVDIIQDNNDSWTVGDDGMAFYNLERDDEDADPVWTMAELVEDEGFMWARVNATTGAYLGAGTFDFDFGWSGSGNGSSGWGGGWSSGWSEENRSDGAYAEGGSFSGQVSVSDDTNEHAFSLAFDDHEDLRIQLRPESPGTGNLNVTVEGPEGQLGGIQTESQPGTDDDTYEKSWDDPAEGDYTITVQLADGVERSYTIHWCAHGESSGDEEASQACAQMSTRTEPGLAPLP